MVFHSYIPTSGGISVLGKVEKLTRDVAWHRLVVEFGKLAGKQGVVREFPGQVGELRPGDIFLFFAERGKRQQDFCIRAQIVSLLRRDAKLLHPGNSVPVDAAKPKKEALMRREAADDVIGGAEREIGIRGVRTQRYQLLRQGFRLMDQA